MNYSILNKKSTFNKEYDWGMLRLNMCEKVIDKNICTQLSQTCEPM